MEQKVTQSMRGKPFIGYIVSRTSPASYLYMDSPPITAYLMGSWNILSSGIRLSSGMCRCMDFLCAIEILTMKIARRNCAYCWIRRFFRAAGDCVR